MSKLIKAAFLACIVLFSIPECIAQNRVDQLDSIFNTLNIDGELSGAFLVVDEGKILYEKYLGYEDIEKSKPINSQSRFELASVSKQFTAMAIMQLAQQGKLSYQDQISQYFPELPFAKVTIDNLLRHTSGVPEFLGFDNQWIDRAKINTNADILNILVQHVDSTSFKPNTHFAYSNTNYILLALIVEKVSGLNFDTYMREYVFKPSKMTSSSVLSARSTTKPLTHYARGFGFDVLNDSFQYIDDLSSYAYLKYFDGIAGPYGISSTARDLMAWDQALTNGTILSNQEFKKALEIGSLNNDSSIVGLMDSYVGYGWMFRDTTDNGKMHFHTGGWPGYQAIVVREPANKRLVVVLINKWNMIGVLPIMGAIQAILDGKTPPVLTRQKFDGVISLMEFQVKELIGSYAYTESAELKYHITANEEGKIFAQLTGQSSFEVYPSSDVDLFYTEVDAKIKFQKEGERVTKLTLFQNGLELVFTKEN